MKYLINWLVLLVGILFLCNLFSCTKTDINQAYSDTPVIEGYLYPGKSFSVSIRRQIPFIENAVISDDNINQLIVQAEINGTSHLLNSDGNGVYSNASIPIAENQTCTLIFTFNQKLVKAYTYIPSQPTGFKISTSSMTIAQIDTSSRPPSFPQMPDPITVSWDNADGSYYLITVENIETTLEAIRDFGDRAPPGNVFRKTPTASNSEELRANDFQYYGTHRLLLHHVLPDYASLYNSSNNTSQNLTNPSTSIENGYGIFSGIYSDTLYIEIKKE